jgi:hypothetical protein
MATTTNLFVELLVIGVGASCWIGLLVLTAFGIELTQIELLKTYPVLMSLLAVVYLLGIVSDRIADSFFDKLFSRPLRAKYFDQKRDYQDARRVVFNRSDRLADMHEYGRTRIRVCRGWSLNAALIAICLNVFLRTHCYDEPWFGAATRWGTLGFVALSVASWWSWRTLCLTEYLKIREHAEFLKSHPSRPRLRNAA